MNIIYHEIFCNKFWEQCRRNAKGIDSWLIASSSWWMPRHISISPSNNHKACRITYFTVVSFVKSIISVEQAMKLMPKVLKLVHLHHQILCQKEPMALLQYGNPFVILQLYSNHRILISTFLTQLLEDLMKVA